MDIEASQKIPISFIRQPDLWAWHYDKRGLFTVKSAYRMILDTKRRREIFLERRSEQSNYLQEEKGWKTLWKVKVPSKLRLFAWRLARASLPTGEVRMRRKMATVPRRSVLFAMLRLTVGDIPSPNVIWGGVFVLLEMMTWSCQYMGMNLMILSCG